MLRGVLCSGGGQRDVEKTFQLFLPQSGGLLSTAHSQDGRSFHYLNNIISIFEHAGHPPKIGLFEGCPEVNVFAKKRQRQNFDSSSKPSFKLFVHCEKFAFLAQKCKEAK